MSAEIQNVTAIVLARTDYGEADRIVRLLTKEKGKLSVMAKGARKNGSKLAGGIEIFSESQCAIVKGRGDLYTLASSRMLRHFGALTSSLEKVTLAYRLLQLVDKHSREDDGRGLYPMLVHSLEELNQERAKVPLVEAWFLMQLLQENGHGMELRVDSEGNKLASGKTYMFVVADMSFAPYIDGPITENHIKVLRLLAEKPLKVVTAVKHIDNYAADLVPLLALAEKTH